MATTVKKYLEKCYAVYEAKPVYKNGASDLKECDCIGMDKYAFRENNVRFSTTGTNYSMRNQVEDVRTITGVKDLVVGDVVFKAREPGEKGYDLPEKYQQGGSGYNGDLRDYYHIGTVRSVSPLQIIHMTSPTAQMDTTLNGKGWDFAARWRERYISKDSEPAPEPQPQPVPTGQAVVVSENGKTVKMRSKPSTQCNLYWDVPVGATVTVLEQGIHGSGYEWSRIVYGKLVGYMMSRFLRTGIDTDGTLWTVHIPHLHEAQAQALLAQYGGAYMTKE